MEPFYIIIMKNICIILNSTTHNCIGAVRKLWTEMWKKEHCHLLRWEEIVRFFLCLLITISEIQNKRQLTRKIGRSRTVQN